MSPVLGFAVLGLLGLIAVLGLMPKKLYGSSSPGSAPAAGEGPAPGGAAAPDKYPYAELIRKWAGKYGVDPDLVAAHMKVESSFNALAINKEGSTNESNWSWGLMQVKLITAQDFGAVMDWKSPTAAEKTWLMAVSNNVQAGAWNVARWQKRYPWDVAVQMYNVGEAGFNNKGYRNADYLEKVRRAYNGYK